jgi:predicted MFS family arabinose efflux permease
MIGGMAGPAVGGLLAAISITAPFFFYAATLAVAGLVGMLLLHRGSGRAASTDEAAVIPFRQVLRDRGYQAACLSNLAQGWTSFGVRSALVPVLVVEVLHRPTSWTGAAFACASVAQTIAIGPAGRIVDTVGRRSAMVGGSALAAISILAVPFVPDIGYLIAALCGYGVASAFLGTAPTAAVGDASGGRGGTPVAVFSMCADVGAIVGPLVAGLLADRVSYPVAFGVGAALLLAASAFALRMPADSIGQRMPTNSTGNQPPPSPSGQEHSDPSGATSPTLPEGDARGGSVR